MDVKTFKSCIYRTMNLKRTGNEIGHLLFDVFSRKNQDEVDWCNILNSYWMIFSKLFELNYKKTVTQRRDKNLPVQVSRLGPKISSCAFKWSTGAVLTGCPSRDTKNVSKCSIIWPLCRSIENVRDSRTGISWEPNMNLPRLNTDKKRPHFFVRKFNRCKREKACPKADFEPVQASTGRERPRPPWQSPRTIGTMKSMGTRTNYYNYFLDVEDIRDED